MSTTTFVKRQKEMKRQEKQRAKAERRAQRKLERQAQGDLNESAKIEGVEPDPNSPAVTSDPANS